MSTRGPYHLKTHGETAHGRMTPEYVAWRDITKRCTNQKFPDYHRYGGRGIQICQRWRESYTAFVADVGRRPTPTHSIERIDNDGHYEPGNVCWATKTAQANNRRGNLLRTIDDHRISLCAAARYLAIDWQVLRRRFIAAGVL